MVKHAKFSPSQLPRILRCPGSVQLTEKVVDTKNGSSKWASEGTCLHSVTEECLTRGEYRVHKGLIKQFELNEDHIGAVQACLDFVKEIETGLRRKNEEFYTLRETSVTMAGYAREFNCEELKDVYGTLDYCIGVKSRRLLYIIDWKFGKGVEVMPDSEQLMAYAVAKLKDTEYARSHFDKVIIVVAQPRLHHDDKFKMKEYTVDELLEWAEHRLVPALRNAMLASPTFCAGEKACKWCGAKYICEFKKRAVTEAAQKVFEVHARLDTASIDDLVGILDNADLLQQALKDAREQIYTLLSKGEVIKGYKMVKGRPTRKWKGEEDTVRYLKSIGKTDDEIYEPRKVKSPAQIELLLGEGKKVAEFRELFFTPEGALTMVPESDRREAVTKNSEIESKFAKYAI